MRIALIGGGTIARLVLENVQRGKLPGLEVVALMGRAGGAPRARELAREFGVKYSEHTSLRTGILSHYRWLRRMGVATPAGAAGAG